MKFAMRISRLCVLGLLLLAPAVWAQAQTGSISGTVTDADDGLPLPGANVFIAGTAKGAATDVDGNYRITGLAAGTYTVIFSFTGYQNQEIEVTLSAGEERQLDVALSAGIELDPIQVTAGRKQEKALDAPASIDVLGIREIEQDVAPSSVKALRNTTGVDMVQTGIDRHEVVLRGFNNAFSGATYVLTDYRQAAVPSLGLNVHSFMPNIGIDVERIEVVRGPGSALYGAGVDAGVIHYFTKDPFTYPGATISVSGGEQSLINVQGRIAGVIGEKVGVKVTGTFGQADDFEFDPNDLLDAAQLDGDQITPRRNDYEKLNVNGTLEYRLDDQTALIVNSGFSQLTATVLSGIGTVQADGFGYTYGQLRFQRGSFFAQAYANLNNAGDSFVYDSGVDVVDKGALYNAQAQYDLSFANGRSDLIIGVDLELTRPDTEGTTVGRNEDRDNIDEYGVYAQSSTQLSPKLDLTLGVRGDYNNVVEVFQVSPRVALVYKPTPEHTLRATYNRAFSSPSTNSNFIDIRAVEQSVGGPFTLVFMGRGPVDGFTFDGFRSSNTALFSLGVPGVFGQPIPVSTVPLAPIYGAFAEQTAGLLTSGAPLPAPLDQLPAPARATLAGILQSLTAFIGPTAVTPGTLGIPDDSQQGFRTVAGPIDIKPLDQTITQTIEVGYKGLIQNRVLLAIDGYYSKKKDFVGPLTVESPLVYLENLGPDMAATLTPILQAAAQDPQTAGFLAAIGLTPETAAGLMAGLAAQGFAGTPVAVVQPDQAVLPPGSPDTEVGAFLSYRNFGDVDYFGIDASVQVIASKALSLFGNISFVSDDFFDSEDLGEDNEDLALSLNAPKFKAKLGASYTHASGFSVNASGRYTEGFPVLSGPYVGDVEEYFLIDLGAGYAFPNNLQGLRLDIGVSNLLDDDHREFIGAPKLGRVAMGRLTYTFDFNR